jgi:phosphatidylglycerophosphatase A
MSERLDPKLLLDPVHLLALGFGAGLSPWAPGTAGTLVALLPAWGIAALSPAWQWSIAAGLLLAGIALCGASARKLGIHDHPGIVFDEIAAMIVLAIVAPRGLAWLAAAFVIFRLFDILKPWPIRDMDHRLPGGIGIMLDDLMAALYAALCLRVVEFFIAAI